MLDLKRQTGVIPEEQLVRVPVHIIGVGAIGSNLANQISRTGMLRVTLWDFDRVEGHNIPNQAFGESHLGQNKAEAMAQLVKEFTGLKYKTMDRWNGEDLSGSVVFSCVDTMRARKQLIESMKDGLFIETRMGVRHGQIYTIDTSKEEDVNFWKSHWVNDDIIEEKSACGTSLTIGSTANLLSSIAAWQLIRYLNDTKCLDA